MVFKQAPLNTNFDIVRFVSASGRWEIGLRSVLYGVRVRFGEVGNPGCDLDYCAGADPEDHQTLLRTCMLILLPVSEDLSNAATVEAFPPCRKKPIFLDEECWRTLQELAQARLQEAAARK